MYIVKQISTVLQMFQFIKFRIFWDVPASIILKMEAVRTSETSVHFNLTTRRHIPKDFILAAVRT
jgi:hypothetical protein